MLMYAWGSLCRYVLKGRCLIYCVLSAALFLFSHRMESSIGFTKNMAGDAWKAYHSTRSSATAMGAALHQSNCRPGATIASTPEYTGVVNNCADWLELPFFPGDLSVFARRRCRMFYNFVVCSPLWYRGQQNQSIRFGSLMESY